MLRPAEAKWSPAGLEIGGLGGRNEGVDEWMGLVESWIDGVGGQKRSVVELSPMSRVYVFE